MIIESIFTISIWVCSATAPSSYTNYISQEKDIVTAEEKAIDNCENNELEQCVVHCHQEMK